jgi:hypothetical protein
MKAVVRNLIFVLIVLFLSQAAMAVGAYTYNCNTMYLWDVSGTYDEDYSLLDDNMDITGSFNIVQDPQGKFSGSGNVGGSCYVMGYDVNIDMDMLVTGTITQKNNVATVKMNAKITGTVGIDGYGSLPFKGTEKITATVDPKSKMMTGKVSVSLRLKGLGTEKVTQGFSEALSDDDMDGSFTMTMDTNLVDGKKLTGIAQIILSNGDVYDFTAAGKYNPKKNIDTVTLKGIGSIVKSSLKTTANSTNGQIISVSGKVLGQNIKGVNITP